MTTNFKLLITAFFCLQAIFSCGNKENSKNKTADSTTSSSSDKQNVNASQSIAGTYNFGEDAEGPNGSLMIYPLSESTALFYIEVSRGAPSYNSGGMLGQMTINKNLGTYDSKIQGDDFDCLFTFEFTSDQVTIKTSEGREDCGFGYGVRADNDYKRIDNSLPKYFLTGEGDTILFQGLTIEKYKNRF